MNLFFWRKKKTRDYNTEQVLNSLPEFIEHDERSWGLRVKKEKSRWYVRYVTRSLKVRVYKYGGYDSLSPRGSKSLRQAGLNMRAHLRGIKYHAIKEPIYK